MTDFDFKTAPDEELERIVHTQHPWAVPAAYELQKRQLEKSTQKISIPHWTLVPTFWLVVASIIIALVALFLALRADMRAIRSKIEIRPTAPESPNSGPVVPPQAPKSQPVPSQKKP